MGTCQGREAPKNASDFELPPQFAYEERSKDLTSQFSFNGPLMNPETPNPFSYDNLSPRVIESLESSPRLGRFEARSQFPRKTQKLPIKVIKKPRHIKIETDGTKMWEPKEQSFSPPIKSPSTNNKSNSPNRNYKSPPKETYDNTQDSLEIKEKIRAQMQGYNKQNQVFEEIKNYIPSHVLESNDLDQILYAGPLLKYKPGIHFNWIERYCILTKRELRYYKSEWIAKCPDLKPLMIVPTLNIVGAYRISINVPISSISKTMLKSDHKTYNELFPFEIFNSHGDYPYQDEYIQPDVELSSQSPSKVDIEKYEGFKLWETYEEERNSHRHPVFKPRGGYLMRSPVSVKGQRNSINSPERGSSPGYPERFLSPQGSAMKEFKFPVNTGSCRNSPAKKTRNGDTYAAKRPTFKCIKDPNALISWSGREKEWHFSEKRLLFATLNSQDRERWLAILDWLIQEN